MRDAGTLLTSRSLDLLAIEAGYGTPMGIVPESVHIRAPVHKV